MKVKISHTSSIHCYPKRIKRFFQKNLNYHHYDEYISHMDRAIVGNVPKEIINLFKQNKKEKILAFQQSLADMAMYIRKNRKRMEKEHIGFMESDIYSSEKIKLFEKEITSLFNEKLRDVLPQGYRVELNYANSGGFANLFRLSLKNSKDEKIMHDKALKVYYFVKEKLLLNAPYHNNYAEANSWTFLKYFVGHNLDKTQFTNHYISDMKSGYCLTDFADKDIHPVKKIFNFKKMLRVSNDDYENNKPLFGKLYDIGGIVKDIDFINDRVVLKYYKKLCNRNSEKDLQLYLDILNKRIQNPKTPHRDKIIKAIKCFEKEKFKQLSPWQKFMSILNSIFS